MNPVEPDNETRPLSRTYYPTDGPAKKAVRGIEGVTTPFMLYRNYYAAQCLASSTGYRYLGILGHRRARGQADRSDRSRGE